MARWQPIRMRNALTESYNEGRSLDHIMYEHGLSADQVVDWLDANRAGFTSPRDEEWIEKRTKSEKLVKKSDTPVKVIPRPTDKNVSEARTGASARTCVVCGDPIPPTGKRGRPRLTHEECAK